ncbi:MAG: hypothetical protein K0U64_05680 [Actinomycetia bacterium]|nr:hypothetical protein [Actinomycetes bacterium]
MSIPPPPIPGRAVFGIGIGASALSENAADPALQRVIHEELLEDLAVHGRLVFTSEADLAGFLAAVRNLPTTLSKAWEALLSSKRVSVSIADPESNPGLGQVLEPDVLEERMAPDLQLVLLETDQARLLGVRAEDFSARTPGGLVEIGRLATATRTATVLAARSVLDAPLREGGNRETEWEQRLEPLVRAGKPVVIYDKYVGLQTARRYVHERDAGDGLTWLLGRIAMQPGRRVRIITATSRPDRFGNQYDEDVMSLAFGRLKNALGREIGIDVVLVPERGRDAAGRTSERFGHDRHLRFGDRAAIALGMGIQSFAKTHFTETITVARLPIRDAKSREERATRSAIRPPPRGWLGWTFPDTQ